MIMVSGKKPSLSTLYPAQRRDGILLSTIECSTRHWLDPFTRTKYSLLLKKNSPPKRELADKTAE